MSRRAVVPSLYSPDIEATIDFYTATLGFRETGRYEDRGKVTWVELSLADAPLWFFANPLDDRPEAAMSGMIFIFVEDVDEIADRLRGRVTFRWGPETQFYGQRELGIEDPDGYLLVFAAEAREGA